MDVRGRSGWIKRWDAGPLDARARFLLLGVGGMILALGVTFALAVGDEYDWPLLATVTMAVLLGVVGAVGLVLLQLSEWRQQGGLPQIREVERVARTGVLPEDADPRFWLPRLEGLDQGATGSLVFGVLFLLAASWRLIDAENAFGIVFAGAYAVLGLMLIARFVVARRRRVAVKRLLFALAERWQLQLGLAMRS